ncbi:hypothetical protein AAA315_17915, partial [Ruthenibacterium lactatiformans]
YKARLHRVFGSIVTNCKTLILRVQQHYKLSLNLESQKEVLKENAPMQTYVLKAGAITVRGNLIYTPAHKPHDGGKHFAAMAENHKVDGCAIKYMGSYEINDLAKSVYTEREISWLKKEQSFWAICTRFSNGLEFFK